MVQIHLLPSRSGNPRDKSGPSGPGVGNCLKQSYNPGGTRAGKIESNLSLFL